MSRVLPCVCRRARGAGGSAPFGEVRGSIRRFLGPELVPVTPAQTGCTGTPDGYPRPMSRVALLGGGKMGAALVGGLLEGGFEADALSIAEIDGERRVALEQQFSSVRVV